MMRPLSFLVLSLVTAGCGGASDPEPNLPPSWETATRLGDFTQSACDGDPGEEPERTQEINMTLSTGFASVSWTNAPFRCEQPLEAYVRRTDTVEILVQPIDMSPAEPARCDCFYNLDFALNVTEEDTVFTFFVRRDEAGGPSAPARVGQLTVE